MVEEFDDVRQVFQGLGLYDGEKEDCVITGVLSFTSNLESGEITDSYEVRIHVTRDYPQEMPTVLEIGGRIPKEFHRNSDGSLCLASRVQARLTFETEKTLLGFIRNLIVPFLYSYSYFERFGTMPFGELKHGGEGLLEDYMVRFKIRSPRTTMLLVAILAEKSYRGHHACPCQNGEILRRCHGTILRALSSIQRPQEFLHDLLDMVVFVQRNDHLELPKEFTKERIRAWGALIDGRNGKRQKNGRAMRRK